MDPSTSHIDFMIAEARERLLDLSKFEAFCRSTNLTFNDLCNAIALTIARRFNEGSLAFDDADRAMNGVWHLMVQHLSTQGNGDLAEPAYSIFEAFDAGEFSRRPGDDPVEDYTKPYIRHILRGV